jgi:ParB-like chromosome segregation protein Spo0J
MQLPDIDPEVRARLNEEMRRWGRVLVPLVVDEHDDIIDGEMREELAQELGITNIPRVVVKGLTADERRDLRLRCNCVRRHLNREQVREWIRWELLANPDHSDRKIAALTGTDHKTVGKVRAAAGEVPQLPVRLGRDGKRRAVAVVHTQTEAQRKQAQDILRALAETPDVEPLSMRKLRSLRWHHEREQMVRAAKPVSVRDIVIHHCDFRQAPIPDRSADLVVNNPPWAR